MNVTFGEGGAGPPAGAVPPSYFTTHDPTTKDRQGADHGPQYRSVVFYESDARKAAAGKKFAELNAAGVFPRPAVTEPAPPPTFYPAEDYHQGYYRGNPTQGYCRVIIAPELARLRQHFAGRVDE